MARNIAERYADWPAFLLCFVCRRDSLNKQARRSLSVYYKCYGCGLTIRVPGAQIDRWKIRRAFGLERL